MSQNITNAYAQEFASNVQLLLQQTDSRFSKSVTPHSITGAKAATVVEQIAATAARKRTTRYEPLVPVDTGHTRPWVYPSDYDWNDLTDSIDKLRTKIDPTGAYTMSAVAALNRAKDDEIINAFFADMKTGEDGSTLSSFPAAQQIAVNFAASGNVGLTVAKLREANRLLRAAEVDLDNDPVWLGISAKAHDNLLGEVQVTSTDFNEKPVLVKGKIEEFLGFKFIPSERLKLNGSSYRRLPAYAQSGMHLATWNEITADVSTRKDLAGYPVQVYAYGTFGATRSENKKVVEIIVAES